MTLYKWSRLASDDDVADTSVNWQENQAPSTVNDAGRGMMAAIAKYRDDVAGAITTGGTSNAYTVVSYQVFDSLAHLGGKVIAFVPHLTNGATVTLNVDGLGAKPLRSAPSTDLFAGMLIQGTPYTCVYNNTDAVFYLRDFYVLPYTVPIGACLDYFGTTAPAPAFALAYGQAISRSTFGTLFSIFGTTYGAGDGSTTFNIPDLRGRVCAGKDDMGGAAASRLSGATITTGGATALGGRGGAETHTLQTTELASHSHNNTLSDSTHTHAWGPSGFVASAGGTTGVPGSPQYGDIGHSTGINSGAPMTISNVAAGGSSAHNNVQPTIICNKLIRVI